MNRASDILKKMYMYLVRHLEYQNPDNIYPFHLPLNLSAKGRSDADKIADWFVNRTLLGIHIYTSPIIRCIQTANIIAQKINSSITTDQRLIESSCSNLQGKKLVMPHPWKVEEDDSTRETKGSIRNRMVNMYDEKVRQDKDCIFVSHGEPLTVLYYYLQSKELPKYLWDPTIGQQVIEKGDVVIVKVENREIASIEKMRLI